MTDHIIEPEVLAKAKTWLEGTYDEDTKQEIRRIYGEDLAKREAKYIPKFHWDNLHLYLKVYDLKIEGKSYSQIAKIMKLNSKDTARNHYRSAITLIKDGIELYGISED